MAIIIFGIAVLMHFFGAGYLFAPYQLQLLMPYEFQSPPTETRYDRNGKVLVGHKQEQFASYDEIPQRLRDVVVAVEDKRFWSHPGVDPWAVLRAGLHNLTDKNSGIQGASTIDQQLIKLDRKQFARGRVAKFTENRRALNLQLSHTKEDILLKYLNIIPFSHGIIGRKSACQSYRGKGCAYLSDEELLVTLMVSQLGANPYRTQDWQHILARAKMYSRVRADLFSGALQIDDTLTDRLQSFPGPIDPRVGLFLRDDAPVGITSYDLALSKRIDALLKNTRLQREQYNIRDCCVVVVDGRGELVTMNMCSDRDNPDTGKINSCLVPRQTGSAVKPFLYLYAFKQFGLKPTDTIVDEPVQFDLGGGNLYDPKNFDLTYHGEVTYAYALGNSLNVPAIKTLQKIGVEPFLHFLQTQLLRVTPHIPLNAKTAEDVGLSLALGTYELSPWQFTQLRRTLLPEAAAPGYEQQRQAIVDILRTPSNKLVSFGQDNFLSPHGRAVKTGTSRKFIDGWICGAQTSQQLTACIRLGNYNNEPMLGASSEVGSYLRDLVVKAIGE